MQLMLSNVVAFLLATAAVTADELEKMPGAHERVKAHCPSCLKDPFLSPTPAALQHRALLRYLSQHVGAPHLLLASSGDDADVVSRSLPDNVSLTLLPCDADVVLLTAARQVLTLPLHTVMLMCELPVLKKLFRTISKNSLENRSLQWLVVGRNNSVRDELLPLLREGTQLAVVTPSSDRAGSFSIERTAVGKDNSVRFEMVKTWKPNSPSKESLEIFPPLEFIYSNFGGRTLTVLANTGGDPFVNFVKDKNGQLQAVGGSDYEICGILAETLNFTFRVVLPPDLKWGGPLDNGTVTGMIGVVARHEGHMAMDSITITERRKTVVDFSYPYQEESSVILSKVPKKKLGALSVIRPLSFQVWLAIVFSVIVMGPIAMAVDNIYNSIHQEEPENQISKFPKSIQNRQRIVTQQRSAGEQGFESTPTVTLHNYFTSDVPVTNSVSFFKMNTSLLQKVSVYTFDLFQILVLQHYEARIKGMAISILLCSWFFFVLLVVVSYSSSLTAVYTIPAYETPIDTFEDVIRAHDDDGVTLLVTKDTSMYYYFMASTFGNTKKIKERLDSKSFKSNSDEKNELVAQGRGISFSTPLYAYTATRKYGQKNFYVGRETFYRQYYGFALPVGAPYIYNIDKTFSYIAASGLVNFIIKKVLVESFGSKIVSQMQNSFQRDADSTSLSLHNMQGAFIVLSFGCAFGLAALIAEKFTRRN